MASHSTPAPAPPVVWVRRTYTPAPDGLKRTRKARARMNRAQRGSSDSAHTQRGGAVDTKRASYVGARTLSKPRSASRAARRNSLLTQGGSRQGNL